MAKYPMFVVDYGATAAVGGVPLKDCFSYALTIGYGLGKVPSYVYVPGVPRRRRRAVLLALFGSFSALMVGLLPLGEAFAALQVLAVAVACVPASAIFGVTLAYMEGRRSGDLLMATINAVVVGGAAACRAAGRALLDRGVPPAWMPLAAVALYAPLALFALGALDATPEPSAADVAGRGARAPMGGAAKSAFLRRHAAGLAPLLIGYALLIAFRSFRDFFALEIYREVLRREPAAADYLVADWVGGAISVAALVPLSRVADNRRALWAMHAMIGLGGVLVGAGTALFERGALAPESWIVLVGVGVYLALTPFCGSFFDRLIAATRTPGTAVFLVFLADGVGYVGTFAMLLYKTTYASGSSGKGEGKEGALSYAALFTSGCYAFGWVMSGSAVASALYFARATAGGGGGGGGGEQQQLPDGKPQYELVRRGEADDDSAGSGGGDDAPFDADGGAAGADERTAHARVPANKVKLEEY